MGGRVIFKPEVFVLGFRESIGFPFFPLLSFGFRVGLRPEGGRVKPLSDEGLALIGGGDGGVGGKEGASSLSVFSTDSCASSTFGAGGGKEGSMSPKEGNGGESSCSAILSSSSANGAGAGGMPKGAGGGNEGSPSSPKEGHG